MGDLTPSLASRTQSVPAPRSSTRLHGAWPGNQSCSARRQRQGTAHVRCAGRGFRSRGVSSAAACGALSAQFSQSLRPPLATGVPPLRVSPAAAPARPNLAPYPVKMAAVRRARSYCRCLVRFSDRELC